MRRAAFLSLPYPTAVFVLLLFCFAFGAASCVPRDQISLQREDLFSLDIGPMEDQISLFVFPDDAGLPRASLAMRDGLFYISDGTGRKVVRYNSFGDLLVLIFNDDTNPDPSDLRIRTEEDGQMTRWAFTFPFRSPGQIAVDSRRHTFVEEILPDERHVFDAENQVLLNSVVLHFDQDGRYIDYLGQGGRGGLPFPRIMGLYTSVNDEIVVVTRLTAGWDVFWYNADGEHLFLIHIRDDVIPAPPGLQDFFISIDAVKVAPDARQLFIKVDYYRDIIDPLTNNRLGTETLNSLVWILNIESGEYIGFVEIPFFELTHTERGNTVQINLLYSMMGVVQGGGMLFYFPVENGFEILRLDSLGQGQRRGFIKVESERLVFNSFHLSPEGILSALLADEWTTTVAWWRMERFMRDG
ncbi:MAG: hypothetical protein FWB78_03915 [Treponema sp.]|nr:hypothetical protein [Treponema sp.]